MNKGETGAGVASRDTAPGAGPASAVEEMYRLVRPRQTRPCAVWDDGVAQRWVAKAKAAQKARRALGNLRGLFVAGEVGLNNATVRTLAVDLLALQLDALHTWMGNRGARATRPSRARSS